MLAGSAIHGNDGQINDPLKERITTCKMFKKKAIL
jgi:hypothetical protein